MRPSKTEIDEGLAARRQHLPRALRCNLGLEMDEINEPRLKQLRLWQWRDDPKHGFVGKEHRALRQSVDIAGKPQLLEIVEELVWKLVSFRNAARSALEKEKFSRYDNACSKPAAQKAAPRRQLANEELEDSRIR